MKKIYISVFLIVMSISFTACFKEVKDEKITNTQPVQTAVNELTPLYANQIKDGSYEITVESSSSMFRVVKCTLNVENGEMSAEMTMSGKGYGKLYMGTGEDALKDTESSYIPFVLNENEQKTFTVPVEALNKETDCAAWSIKKEKWYDRKLVFKADELPDDAMILE